MFKRFVFVGAVAAVMAPVFAVAWSATGSIALLLATLGSIAAGFGCGAAAAKATEDDRMRALEAARAGGSNRAGDRVPEAANEPAPTQAHDTVFALFPHRADATSAHERLVVAGIERDRIDTFGGTGGLHELKRDETVRDAEPVAVASSPATPADTAQHRTLIQRLRDKGGAVVRVRAGGADERREAESELQQLEPTLLLSARRPS